MIFSAGAEEYNSYIAANPTPEKALSTAYATQDGGETWTELKSDNQNAVITVNGNEIGGEIGSDFAIGSENTQEA